MRLPLLLGLAAGLGACSESAPQPAADAAAAIPVRRVILITCDTLRPDHLGVYGYARDTSPELDRFARESVVFETAYSTAPATNPSLSSLFTGRLAQEIGVTEGNLRYLPEQAVTLAEVLRAAGIDTAAVVSNWVLRRVPEQGDVGVQQGFDAFDDDMEQRELNREAFFERRAPATTRAAIVWLEGRKARADAPFFLWVHYQDPHGPYVPPAELAAWGAPAGPPHPPLPVGAGNRGEGEIPAYQVLGDERSPDVYVDRYDGEIRYFDAALGELLDWLREAGLFADSLIVFTADHGESLGEHDRWFCHGDGLSRELVAVPFLVHYPPGVARPPAARVHEGVGHLDVWPTVLEAFGLPPQPGRGRSLLTDRLDESRVLPQVMIQGGTVRQQAMRYGRYRLITGTRRPRVFDVVDDPGELRDLAREQPELLRRLTAAREAFLADAPAPVLAPGPRATLDAEERQALTGLGYLEGAADE